MKTLPTRIELIKEIIKPGSVGAEIGVYRGDFSLEMVKLPLAKLYLVDAWKSYREYALDSINDTNQDANYTDTLSRLKEHIDSGKAEAIRGFSTDVANAWQGPKLDWIFLDSNHAYEYVFSDLMAWSEHIKPGGVIMCHDHTESSAGAIAMKFGVVKAVAEFCKKNGWTITHHTEEGDWPSCAIMKNLPPPAGY